MIYNYIGVGGVQKEEKPSIYVKISFNCKNTCIAKKKYKNKTPLKYIALIKYKGLII